MIGLSPLGLATGFLVVVFIAGFCEAHRHPPLTTDPRVPLDTDEAKASIWEAMECPGIPECPLEITETDSVCAPAIEIVRRTG